MALQQTCMYIYILFAQNKLLIVLVRYIQCSITIVECYYKCTCYTTINSLVTFEMWDKLILLHCELVAFLSSFSSGLMAVHVHFFLSLFIIYLIITRGWSGYEARPMIADNPRAELAPSLCILLYNNCVFWYAFWLWTWSHTSIWCCQYKNEKQEC